MNRTEFKRTFKHLVDSVVDNVPLGRKFYDLAEKFAIKPATVSKWYDGVSVPAGEKRDVVIDYLYEEKKKRDFEKKVFQVLKDKLRVSVENGGHGDWCEIKLMFGDETIGSDYIEFPHED